MSVLATEYENEKGTFSFPARRQSQVFFFFPKNYYIRSSWIFRNQARFEICHLYCELKQLSPKPLSLYPSLTSVPYSRLQLNYFIASVHHVVFTQKNVKTSLFHLNLPIAFKLLLCSIHLWLCVCNPLPTVSRLCSAGLLPAEIEKCGRLQTGFLGLGALCSRTALNRAEVENGVLAMAVQNLNISCHHIKGTCLHIERLLL